MKEPTNLANALVIIACVYFLITGQLGLWGKIGIIVLLLFALGTWGYWHVTDDHKRLLKKQIEAEEARKVNLNAHTQFLLVQSKLFAQGIRR